jgi:hypothetical protein
MRSRLRHSATRCSSDRRFSRNKILASSAARAQTGRWRAAMQALGQWVGSQSAAAASHGRMRSCSGQAQSEPVAPFPKIARQVLGTDAVMSADEPGPPTCQAGEETFVGLALTPRRQAESSLFKLLQCSLRAARGQFCIAERQQLQSGIRQKRACALPGADLLRQSALMVINRRQ